MDKFVIKDVHPHVDGEYPFDLGELIGSFTNREWNIVKELSGVRRGEFREALAANDNDVIVALVYIVLRRAGIEGKQIIDLLWDAAEGQIDYVEGDAEEETAGPPTPPPISAA
jgi:hypothetical protein